MEEQLSLLSVYPEPDAAINEGSGDGEATSGVTISPGGGGGVGGDGGNSSIPGSRSVRRKGGSPNKTAAGFGYGDGGGGVGGGGQAEELSLQEKTDEVLRSITTSFASVTDMFGRPKEPPPPPSPVAGKGRGGGGLKMASEQSGGSDGGGGGGGWDLFKGPSMADMKRRLEGMKVGNIALSPPKTGAQAEAKPAAGAAVSGRASKDGALSRGGRGGGGGGRLGGSLSPAPRGQTQEATGGLALFGESWRDLRRRSTEAVNEAVTKLKTALDDSDDEDLIGGAATGGAARNGGSGIRAAAANPRGNSRAAGQEDDSFWKPFGDGDGGGVGGSAAPEGEPVPLPTAGEVRQKRAADEERVEAERASAVAQAALNSYYGGGK